MAYLAATVADIPPNHAGYFTTTEEPISANSRQITFICKKR